MRKPEIRVAYDIIGSKEKAVAILPQNLKMNEKKAAEIIMKRHKNVKSVLKKMGGRKSSYRLFESKLVAGNPSTEVLHKENNYIIKVNPQLVYFSPRESEERKRIAEMVKPKERVLVLFSGTAPYAIAIKKKQPECEVVCIEINIEAVKYAMKNVRLNRMHGIFNFCLDARNADAFGLFDRIIMPLAETAIDYLDTAFACSKRGTIIHLYAVSGKDFKKIEKRIEEVARDINIKYKIIGRKRVLPFATRLYKVRIDIQAL